ncbi:MAG TPA: MATE family efflux transporter, partial [Flavobacteriaceae bacterium]|nr:MATE family efflux transporter [Flavobacteriaceae bacterium]
MDAARVAKNTGFLYARIIVNIIVSLYSTRLVLEALGVEDFGIYNLVAGVIAMLAFLNSSMAEASLRFMAFAHGEENTKRQKYVFNVSLVLHFLIAIGVVLILEAAGYFLFKAVLEIPEDRVRVAKLVYQYMLVSTFFTIIKVPYDAVLKAHENMLIVALIGILEAILKLLIAIYLSYTTFDQLVVYGVLMAALAVLLIIISFIYCHNKYEEVHINVTKHWDTILFKEMGTFASWSFLTHAAFVITMQGSTIVLNSFFGVIVNAAQGISNQVSNQLKNFLGTMQTALNPVIIKREGKKDRSKMLEASMFGNKISFFVISFLSIPLLIEMPYILNLWLKDVPEFAVIFVRFQIIRLVISTLTQSFYVAIVAIGAIKKFSIWESIVLIAVLPASYLLYKLGAAPEIIYLNLIISSLFIAIIRTYFLNQLGGLSISLF